MSARRAVVALQWTLLLLLVALTVAAGVWRAGGGHWERVETASMGTAAPVNSLLWVEPVDFGSLEVGDFITFHPPGDGATTYSHRVAVVHEDGSLGTQGAITARDPWRITRADVVGEVVWTWPGVGWLVLAAPLLLIGGLVLAVVAWLVRSPTWRTPVLVVGGAVLLCVAIVVHRPFMRAQELGFAEVDGGARATYVSTGLAPVRLQAHRGAHVDLSDGEVGSVLITHRDAAGRYGITMHPRVPLWWWVLLVLACFLPALWSLATAPPRQPPPARRDAAPRIGAHALDRSLRPAGRRPRTPAGPDRVGRRRLPGTPPHRAGAL
ncbi:MAG TPA: S26 family signal peptidase [Nocardioides sp.]|nr:S26 family signal peptidase [Nocardioides sp.]